MKLQPSLRYRLPANEGIRHLKLSDDVIVSTAQLTKLLSQIEVTTRVAVDTEADSLHSYREKLCLLQISVTAVADNVKGGSEWRTENADRDYRSQPQIHDYIIDPLVDLDLAPLRGSLEAREIVLHGADYDLRL